MPGGVCARGGYSRRAKLLLSVAGVESEVFLAGVASATFIDKTDEEIDRLSSADFVELQWDDAAFLGNHPLIGRMLIDLNQDQAIGLRSSMERSTGDEGPAGSFFPAVNVNRIPFRISLPGLGLNLVSDAPIVNDAVVGQIPPYGSVYKLHEPVEFRAEEIPGQERNWTASPSPPVIIKNCDVKLVIPGGLRIEIEAVREGDEQVTFSAAIVSEMGPLHTEVTWALWPRPEIEDANWRGIVTLDGERTAFEFELPRDLFFVPRWFHAVINAPFDGEGAGIVEFPSLA